MLASVAISAVTATQSSPRAARAHVGRLIDADGAALADVAVWTRSAPTAPAVLVAVTDHQGRFAIDRIIGAPVRCPRWLGTFTIEGHASNAKENWHLVGARGGNDAALYDDIDLEPSSAACPLALFVRDRCYPGTFFRGDEGKSSAVEQAPEVSTPCAVGW